MVIRMVDKIINVLKEKQCYDCEHWYYECLIPFDGCERFLELSPDRIAELAEHLEKNDVIKVVRCKDCRYSDVYGKNCFCEYDPIETKSVSLNGYCSYGEKRDEITM